MTEKYLLFSLDDEQSKKLGEVISNSSAKKIANFLAEREASASEIASALNMPLNSVGYNLEKLLDAGIVERVSGFLWSEKGKKIEKYKVANKLIVISPKKTNVYSKLKGIVPAIITSGILTGAAAWFYRTPVETQTIKAAESAGEQMLAAAPGAADAGMNLVQTSLSLEPWMFVGIGCLAGIAALILWNWRKL
ncbi:MAG: winged helix-turn-helix domain-containing protein [archaeon]|jgi:DNA-binding transcriptional ArsR family regulator|nr:winged helix-turn-helix domain-containing protein [archaeon]